MGLGNSPNTIRSSTHKTPAAEGFFFRGQYEQLCKKC